jgi:hypothetical protein
MASLDVLRLLLEEGRRRVDVAQDRHAAIRMHRHLRKAVDLDPAKPFDAQAVGKLHARPHQEHAHGRHAVRRAHSFHTGDAVVEVSIHPTQLQLAARADAQHHSLVGPAVASQEAERDELLDVHLGLYGGVWVVEAGPDDLPHCRVGEGVVALHRLVRPAHEAQQEEQ